MIWHLNFLTIEIRYPYPDYLVLDATNRKAFDLAVCKIGGDKRDRTADLLNAIQALSQLSYTPM